MITNVQKGHQLITKDGIEYYTVDGLEDAHAEMLRLLKIINKISLDNDISYWIDAGSLIGLLRHKGFIPWDDDLDIAMLKADYLKLITCLTEYCKKNSDAFLIFQSPQKHHCCNYFASKHLFYRSQGSPSLIPVKVDIRVYNCIKNSEDSRKENSLLKDTANYYIFGKSYGILKDLKVNKIKIENFFNNYVYNYGLYNPKAKDAYISSPYFEFSNEFDIIYNHIFPLRRIPFSDIEVPIPNQYDYILKELYGDYMKLPSLEHRAPIACEFVKKNISSSFYKNYVKYCFGRKTIITKIWENLYCIRVSGLSKYCKIRFQEKKASMDSDYESEKDSW